MKIGLCMTVKNEAHNIVDCLEPIIDLFADTVIVDTGSTDKTCELLLDRLGIRAMKASLNDCECSSLAVHRNAGFEQLDTPWIMCLDADERISRAEMSALVAMDDEALPEGLFAAWLTDLGNGQLIEDYKLSLFRNGYYKQGLIHDTVQPSLRERGGHAIWTDVFKIRHFPDLRKLEQKWHYYEQRLQCACSRDDSWLRYHWFRGYMKFREGDSSAAKTWLEPVHDQRPELFPVESMNASMLIAAIYAQEGKTDALKTVLESSLEYHRFVEHDFEIKVNFRLKPWFVDAIRKLEQGRLDEIQPYAFPY